MGVRGYRVVGSGEIVGGGGGQKWVGGSWGQHCRGGGRGVVGIRSVGGGGVSRVGIVGLGVGIRVVGVH